MFSVYSANRRTFADGAGRRLENFFWRIWSSKDILDTITGSQVAVLFNAISEEGPLRTTPTQSPRTSRQIGSYRTSQSSPTEVQGEIRGRNSGHSAQRPDIDSSENKKGKGHLEPHRWPFEHTRSTQAIPHQENIKSEAGEADPLRYKTIDEDDGEDSTPTPTPPSAMLAGNQTMPLGSAQSPSALTSVSSQDTIKAGQENTRRPARKRGGYPAHTPANRRRPVTMRRKSSQTQSSGAQSVRSPHTSEAAASGDELPASVGQTTEQPRAGYEPRSAIAPEEVYGEGDSKQTPIGTSVQSSSDGQEPSSQRQQGALVEPDFRNKFVAKTRSAQTSFVSLPSLLRTPSSTTATSASYQASGTMGSSQQTQPAGRVRKGVTFSDEVTTLEQTAPTQLADVPGEEAQALPRTRSQLTMLLERDRLRAGGNGKGEKHQNKPTG